MPRTLYFGANKGGSLTDTIDLADHLDVAAQRDHGELVGRLAPLEAAAGQGRAEADAERLHVDVAPLGHEEVAQLVEENDEAQPDADLGKPEQGAEVQLSYGERIGNPENQQPEHHDGHAVAEQPFLERGLGLIFR